MQKVLEYLVHNYKRTGEKFSLIMIDLDHFKKINDKYGHDGGDTVLTGISKLLEKKFRKVDIKARWGGEEFLIVLPHTDKNEASKIAEKFLNEIRKTIFEHNNIDISVTFSGGVSTYDKNISIESILKEADRALYQAKENGRDRIVYP